MLSEATVSVTLSLNAYEEVRLSYSIVVWMCTSTSACVCVWVKGQLSLSEDETFS